MRRARLSPSPTKTPSGGRSSSSSSRAPSKAASTISLSSTRRFGRSRRVAQSPPTARRPGTASRSAPRSSRVSRDTHVAERLFAESGPVWLASATFWRATSRRAAPRAPARSSSRRWEQSRPRKNSISRAPLSCTRASPPALRRARRQTPARKYTPCAPRRFAAPGRHT